MKKVLLILLVAMTLAFVLMACDEDTDTNTNDTTTDEIVVPTASVVERYLIMSDECRELFGAQTVARFEQVFEETWLDITYNFARNGRAFPVTVVASPNEGGAPGWASGTTTWIRANWMQQRPNDIDILVHEIAHNAQQYGGGRPFFIVEGVAEYVRNRWGMFNRQEGWSLPTRPAANNSYFQTNHREAGAFLVFLTQHFYPEFHFAVEINRAAQRPGSFNLDDARVWTFEKTGYTLQQLWDMFARRPVVRGQLSADEAAGDYTIVQNPIFVDSGDGRHGATTGANLFDGNPATYFYAQTALENTQFWVEWRYETPIVASRFIISTPANAMTLPRRIGSPWTLYGSTDGNTWEQLYRGDGSVTAAVPSRYFFVDLDNEEAFQYFRLVALRGADGPFVRVSNIAIAS